MRSVKPGLFQINCLLMCGGCRPMCRCSNNELLPAWDFRSRKQCADVASDTMLQCSNRKCAVQQSVLLMAHAASLRGVRGPAAVWGGRRTPDTMPSSSAVMMRPPQEMSSATRRARKPAAPVPSSVALANDQSIPTPAARHQRRATLPPPCHRAPASYRTATQRLCIQLAHCCAPS